MITPEASSAFRSNSGGAISVPEAPMRYWYETIAREEGVFEEISATSSIASAKTLNGNGEIKTYAKTWPDGRPRTHPLWFLQTWIAHLRLSRPTTVMPTQPEGDL